MNRQSGSLAPIPVTPKFGTPSQEPLLQFPPPPSNLRRKSKEGRRSWLPFPSRPRNSPIWRPSTGHSPPTPQWPLPRQPISQHQQEAQQQQMQQMQQMQQQHPPLNIIKDREANPALTRTYTRPRDAPLPPPPTRDSSCSSRSSRSSTSTFKDEPNLSPRTREPASDASLLPHPLSPRFPPSPPRPLHAPPPPPPTMHQRNGSFQTRYMNMAMSTQRIPRSHNILSTIFAWMVLLAFVLAPANLCGSADREAAAAGSGADEHVASYKHIPSVPLLAASCTIFGLGMLGMLWLALCWRRNFIWLMNRIYLPLMLNSLAGLIASLVIIDIQDLMWFSVVAYVSLGIEGATLLLTGGLFFYTNYLLLGKLKREHARETSTKNVVDLVKAGKRPPFAPGSVV